MICDGLGHGPLAAAAAAEGVAAFLDDPSGDPATLAGRIHRRMSGTGGGAIGVVRLGGGTARFCGLGNIAASILGQGRRKNMISIPGIAGHQARTIRQFGHGLAGLLGLDSQDQVRVATAVSEISRSAVTAGLSAVLTFGVGDADLVLAVTLDGDPPADGIASAGRLMDQVTVEGNVVRMTKRRLPGVRPDRRLVSEQLAAARSQSALDELRRQNQDLITALEDLGQQKDQLVLLNAELQETNQGVMAMYDELSSELEQTNRGVVALYAELDETSERLRAASESKDRFWANVSHELRTPLNSIIGLTRLLAEPDPDGGALDPERLYQGELIKNSGGTLLALVNDLLDVAKAESGQLHTDPAHVDLAALFGRLRGLARPMAQDKPVTVTVDAAGDPNTPATILTDEVALTGILRNLLSNGIKYTDRGEVRLSVRVSGPRLQIIVADTGIGIPAGLTSHVFEEFYQVPGVRRGGTGLGLPYARRLSRILGGDLTLTSEPGAGTTVVLDLPLRTPWLGTVLLADDDERFRGILRGLLDGRADTVLEAADGRQALAMLKDHPVDLVLADMRMPGLDGGALLARLPAGLPAIIVTSADVPPPPRAAALLRKDELTAERLEFTIRAVMKKEPS